MSQLIFSIGSNLGNRLQYLKDAAFKIDNQIGFVLKSSDVYETPAWGFSSTPFYNACLLVESNKSPQEILSIFLTIEASLGRVRNQETTYSARTIDIDLIAYDDIILENNQLEIPHKLMHLRRFVLQPMLDLNLDWKHPKLNKTIEELLDSCPDDSVIKRIGSF